MSNQTFKNEKNNRGENIKNEAISLLRPLWLGMRDSNPRSRDQNPVPYHLANPQYVSVAVGRVATDHYYTRIF